jgi:hypothetical protein
MQKTFDAVKFQREARADLNRQYLEDREVFFKELGKKYGKLTRSKGRDHRQPIIIAK